MNEEIKQLIEEEARGRLVAYKITKVHERFEID